MLEEEIVWFIMKVVYCKHWEVCIKFIIHSIRSYIVHYTHCPRLGHQYYSLITMCQKMINSPQIMPGLGAVWKVLVRKDLSGTYVRRDLRRTYIQLG